MKPEFIFLTIICIVGLLLSAFCLYTDYKYSYDFQNDKVYDMAQLTVYIILLLTIIKLGVII